MPNIATRSLQYTSEVTGNTGPINFRITRQYADNELANSIGYEPRQDVVCKFPGTISPRYIKVMFENGKKIKFPVGTREEVARQIAVANSLDDVVCVDYFGERWANIPGLGDPSRGYSISNDIDNLNGVIMYSSDTLGPNVGINYSLAQDILPFAAASDECAGRPDTGGVCDTAFDGFLPRRIVLLVKNTGNFEQEKSSIIRRIPISNPSQIIDCLARTGPLANCVGYEGEVCPKANLFVVSGGGGAGGGDLPPFVLPPSLTNLLPGG